MDTSLFEPTLETPLRLFTQSPYPQFEYIISEKPYPYCANQSLFSSLRIGGYQPSFRDITPEIVLNYTYQQTAILKYNNPKTYTPQLALATLFIIFGWGSDNPLSMIAPSTIEQIVNEIDMSDNVEDIIDMNHKQFWYADGIMKPIRFQDEKWGEYTLRVRALKANARKRYNDRNAAVQITEASLFLKGTNGNIIPTPTQLEAETQFQARKIREITAENKVWQTKSSYTLSQYRKVKQLFPDKTQKEIADIMQVSIPTIKKLAQKQKK